MTNQPVFWRLLRLGLIALLSGTLVAFLLIAALAFGYSWRLTHPSCNPSPKPDSGLPAPQEIWLVPEPGVHLRAWYYPADGPGAVVALGGMGGALGDQLPPVSFLWRQGISVLQIDSRACAQPPQPVTLGAKEALDAKTGLAYLQRQPGIRRVGLTGFSMGAAAAIRAAARNPQAAAVVAEGGYYNLGEDFVDGAASPGVERLFLHLVAASYWMQSGSNPWQASPIDDLPRISPRPVLLIYGTGEAASGKAQEQYDAARGASNLWLVPGGVHGLNYSIAGAEYERRVGEFFAQALR